MAKHCSNCNKKLESFESVNRWASNSFHAELNDKPICNVCFRSFLRQQGEIKPQETTVDAINSPVASTIQTEEVISAVKGRRCSYCKKNLSLFEAKISKNVDGQKIYLCETCVDNWKYYRKKEIVSKLCQQGHPEIHFIVPSAKCHDPDDYNTNLYGSLVFTEKAVCFFEFASAEKSYAGWQFGFIGGAIGALFDKNVGAQILSKQIGEIKKLPDFEELARTAKFLIVIPKETITKINVRGGGWEGADPAVEIKASKHHYFDVFIKAKELHERFDAEVKRYLQN